MKQNNLTMRFALLTVALALAPGAAAQALEYDINRAGSDYRDFELRRADPEQCRLACSRESECQAWTYVKPGVQGERAHCWLKNEVPDPGRDDCCISGLKRSAGTSGGASRGGGSMEPGMNRGGSDYRDFELSQASPRLCQAACAREGECLAWTYVKPAVQGEKAHCWLKNEIPEAYQDDCCTSGVKNPRR